MRAVLRLIGIVVSIGLADSLNPTTIVPALYFATGDRARGRMRNPAEALPLAHFRRVEPLLDGAKIADRDVGLLHLRDRVDAARLPRELRHPGAGEHLRDVHQIGVLVPCGEQAG